MAALGLITRVRSEILQSRNAAPESPYYTTTYEATKTSAWNVPTLVPCPPIQWTNPHSTPIVQTTTVTKTLPGTTAYTTSVITKTVPSYTTVTDTDTYYTWSTLTKYTTFTAWTTETSYTGGSYLLFGASRYLGSGHSLWSKPSEPPISRVSMAAVKRAASHVGHLRHLGAAISFSRCKNIDGRH